MNINMNLDVEVKAAATSTVNRELVERRMAQVARMATPSERSAKQQAELQYLRNLQDTLTE